MQQLCISELMRMQTGVPSCLPPSNRHPCMEHDIIHMAWLGPSGSACGTSPAMQRLHAGRTSTVRRFWQAGLSRRKPAAKRSSEVTLSPYTPARPQHAHASALPSRPARVLGTHEVYILGMLAPAGLIKNANVKSNVQAQGVAS